MAEDKKSFVLYADLIYTINKMPNDKAGELFKHILAYVNGLDPQTEDMIIDLTFEPIKQQLIRDLEKYKEAISERSSSGKLGNLKRWNKDLYDKVIHDEIDLEDALIIAENRKTSHSDNSDKKISLPIAKIADNVNVSVNDNVNKNILSFDEFWDLYDKKSDRKKCETKYNSLPIKDKQKIKEVLHKYIQSTPDVQFRKNPSTWLNGKCWNDEIINQGFTSQRFNKNIPTPPQNFGKSFFDLVNEQE